MYIYICIYICPALQFAPAPSIRCGFFCSPRCLRSTPCPGAFKSRLVPLTRSGELNRPLSVYFVSSPSIRPGQRHPFIDGGFPFLLPHTSGAGRPSKAFDPLHVPVL